MIFACVGVWYYRMRLKKQVDYLKEQSEEIDEKYKNVIFY